MKTALSTKLTLSVCALVGGVFISSASAKPFKLFSNDRDRDRDREEEADSRPKVYIVTDEPIQPGSTGIVRVIPKAIAVDDVPKEEPKAVLKPEPKSRKPQKGETRFLEEPQVIQEETTTGITVPRNAQTIEATPERVTTTEERQAPAKTSRSSSRKESVATTKKKVPQPQREEEAEVKTEVATTRQKDRETPVAPQREAVEESTSTSVARTSNPLIPNPSSTEERIPLMPAEISPPRQETTVTKEVTTSRTAPAVQEAPPEQQQVRVQQVEEKVGPAESPTPSPEVPTLSAPSDFANATTSPRPPANLPSGTIEKTGSKPNIPVAEKTDKPGFVNTPFTPTKLIDVRGMASGSLAKDPSTNQVFRVP